MTDTPPSGRRDAAPLSKDDLKASIRRYARYSLGGDWESLTRRERFLAVSLAVREPIIDAMLGSERRARESGAKRVYYLSMEFLLGRVLGNNLLNLGLLDAATEALEELGEDLAALEEQEPDPALGNGGLGRLAACFLDSMATLGIPGYGCGINYEFGLFRQRFEDGFQRELPDEWRSRGTPWLLHRHDLSRTVRLYGKVRRRAAGDDPRAPAEWLADHEILGVPSDLPVVGFRGETVNHLRLYAARASEEFDMSIFNAGDYVDAVRSKIDSERISKVLYPPDDQEAGRELRLIQEYFFVACALADILERHAPDDDALRALPERVAVQLNDTHPALAVAEWIRLLVDERGVRFDEAVRLTRGICAYTNHTLLPEALERWPSSMLRRVLPRHLELIAALNEDQLAATRAERGEDHERDARMSILEPGDDPHVRMGHLSVVGSHTTNGVSTLHSELVRRNLFPDFAAADPARFQSKTNGVTQRRWLARANPALAGLIDRAIGDGWALELDRLRELEPRGEDDGFLTELAAIKRLHKERLAGRIQQLCDVRVDPASLFDVHIKRFHEYKRQLMNALRIVHDYVRLVEDDVAPPVPRTYVFGGKAAPGYARAKQIIKLINEIARVVNGDPKAAAHMKVAFLPDYRVTLAEQIIPAADLSEQISTAGMEASGTGNMKFMMNGALTVGTLDGANIEMAEEAGRENLFVFGLTADEVAARRAAGYSPAAELAAHPESARALDAVTSTRFHADAAALFGELADDLRRHDHYMVLADLPAFLEVQQRIAAEYRDGLAWQRKCLRNIARSGRFSSDRTIREYAREIWGIA